MSNDGTPAPAGTALVLAPPAAVPAVPNEQADTLVKLEPGVEERLDQTVSSYVESLATLDPTSTEFQHKTDAIHSMGDQEIRQAASVSNRMLDRPVRAMDSGLFDNKSQLEASITDGTVSALKHTNDREPVLQVTTPITHGNSGGPAINLKAEVIGLATFGNRDKVQGFKEARRVLRPGGHFLLNVWNRIAENVFADVATEVTFEDGRKGTLAARVAIRDMQTYPVAAKAMERAA